MQLETLFRSLRRPYVALAALLAIMLIAGCGGDDANGPADTPGAGGSASAGADIGKDDKANLTGAGATFPAPLYQAWFDDYNKKIAKGVRVNYQAIGSGGGIQQFTEKTVDFGASDAPMTDEEIAKAGDAQHIPTVMGAVVMTYNLKDVTAALKFDGATVAKIYLGQITKWNDPAIAALNAGAKLPDANIQVVQRSDGSGTTFVFTDWLAKVSPDWKTKVGANKNPQWPVGQGGKGNDGVTNVVKQTPNAIGYVELNYAIVNKLPFADLKNKAGKFITPSIESTSQAAAGVTLPEDYRISITDPAGEGAYPMATFTYLLVHKNASSCTTAKPLVNMLWWVFHDASAMETAKSLVYSPLPQAALTKVEATLKSLQCEGKPVLA